MEAQEFFQGGNSHQPPPYAAENRPADNKAGDHFMVEDLLDFTNDDGDDTTAVDSTFDSSGSSAITAVDGSNYSFSGPDPPFGDPQFSGDLCVPCDELAELEWLSNFVEESFSNEDFQKLQLNPGPKTRPADEGSEIIEFQPVPDTKASTLRPESPVPGKARSKRSRAVQGAWTSRLLLSSADSAAGTDPTAASKKTTKASAGLEKCSNAPAVAVGDGRRCLHCATDKTPQWRTGPMGPKTLCNACGVRYKSGRLVPEYRPASSPTFVLTKHSNSHRKVMELRRQKELMRSHPHPNHPPLVHHHESMIFDVTNGEDYLIHHHVGPDFRQMI